ncbi:class F sortase [Streptomyces cavernae]|uniref:class F sortase n=1 Tax=Streptomyces cavernae TaxID=2259034 RepID=UPI000FEB9987|nr:class F sortase [Streptomyces cavernae]
MEPGHKSSASPQPFIPSVKLLAWALVAGSVLVISALHDEQPPQPSAAQAFSAPGIGTAPGLGTAPGQVDAAGSSPTDSLAGTGAAGIGAAGSGAAGASTAIQPLPHADPVRLRIPAIRVDAPMTRLGLDATGALQPPTADTPELAGWYGDGTAPGSAGTAVTAGHVDTRTGRPGVFHRLGALTKGATIEVDRADRRTAVFTVGAVELYTKDGFPDEKVYGTTGLPELRVITCGGGYARKTGYRGNVVVYATLTAVR